MWERVIRRRELEGQRHAPGRVLSLYLRWESGAAEVSEAYLVCGLLCFCMRRCICGGRLWQRTPTMYGAWHSQVPANRIKIPIP